MNNSIAKIAIISSMILLILSTGALAIGIKGPVKYFEVFTPNKQIVLEYEVLSNMPSMDVSVGTEAPPGMESYISADTTGFFLKNGDTHPLTVTMNLPAEIQQPGPHEFFVIAGESPPKMRGQSAAASGAVKSKIIIFVPYPGKYVEGEFDAPSVKEGEEMAIDLILKNLGGENINRLSANVEIYDHEGNVIEKLQAYEPGNKNDFEMTIAAEQTRKMYVDWTPAVGLKGAFDATAYVKFDDKETTVNGTFIIGYKDVEFLNTTPVLYKGGVTEYHVLINSLWNEPLEDTYIDVVIKNSSGSDIDNLRSSKFDLRPLSQITYKTFLNTETMPLGNYSANIKFYFGDRFGRQLLSEHDATFELVERIRPANEQPFQFGNMIMIIVLIIVILLIIGGNVFFFMFMKKKKKERRQNMSAPPKSGKPIIGAAKKKKKEQKDELEKTAEQELADLENIDLD